MERIETTITVERAVKLTEEERKFFCEIMDLIDQIVCDTEQDWEYICLEAYNHFNGGNTDWDYSEFYGD